LAPNSQVPEIGLAGFDIHFLSLVELVGEKDVSAKGEKMYAFMEIVSNYLKLSSTAIMPAHIAATPWRPTRPKTNTIQNPRLTQS
jgi:hypothetical protein